jgi:hypothetical protein
MKIIPIILYILFSSGFVAISSNSNLDTVYLQDKKAWDFYTHFEVIINERRRHILDVLMDNDPKHRDAFYVIDHMIDNNVNPESIVKSILSLGVRRDFLPRYKVFFLQQMTGAYYPPGAKKAVGFRAPDNLMYVVDKKTRILKFMKSWNFDAQYDNIPEDINTNRQTVGKDVFDILQMNLSEFARFGYKQK